MSPMEIRGAHHVHQTAAFKDPLADMPAVIAEPKRSIQPPATRRPGSCFARDDSGDDDYPSKSTSAGMPTCLVGVTVSGGEGISVGNRLCKKELTPIARLTSHPCSHRD